MSDVFGVHFFFEQRAALLQVVQPGCGVFERLFQGVETAVLQFRRLLIIHLPLRLLDEYPRLVHLFLDGLHLDDGLFFRLPAGRQGAALLFEVCQLFFKLFQPLLAGFVLLFF